MEIRLEQGHPPELRDPLRFREFAVLAVGFATGDELRRGLALVGVPDEDGAHVYVCAEWLLDQNVGTTDRGQWLEDMRSMIGAAAARGWVDARGRVRAHVVRAARDRQGPAEESS
jgi:hypothetical protein